MDPMNIQLTTNNVNTMPSNTRLNYPKHFESRHYRSGADWNEADVIIFQRNDGKYEEILVITCAGVSSRHTKFRVRHGGSQSQGQVRL